MDITNCKKCGRAFGADGNDLCTRCRYDSEDAFKLVKEYLYEHPRASVSEVSDETGVSEKLILQFLREERIEIVEGDNTFLDCEKCGDSITSGRYCKSCIDKMKKEFSNVVKRKNDIQGVKVKSDKNSNQMFTAERRKKD